MIRFISTLHDAEVRGIDSEASRCANIFCTGLTQSSRKSSIRVWD
jgi:hypothetical protein